MQKEKLNAGQVKVTATGFLSLFSIVGIMFYGLSFFFDFWVTDFGWSRATVTSGNLFGKIIIGPLFGFVAGWFVDRFGLIPDVDLSDNFECNALFFRVLSLLAVTGTLAVAWLPKTSVYKNESYA